MEINWPENVPQSEINMRFVQGMANALATSFFKYGKMRDKPGNIFDHKANIRKRLQKYEESGNTEWLIDVANFAMIEFTNPSHPDAHFEGTDSDASPGLKYVGGKWVQKPD